MFRRRSGTPEREDKASIQLIYPLKGGLEKGLRESLGPEEELLACMPTGGEALVVTNERVMILKGGFSSGAMFGRKAKTFLYGQITSVEVSKGLIMGRLQLSAAGTSEHSVGGRLTDAMQAENLVTFPTASTKTAPGYAEFTEGAGLIRKLMREARSPAAAPAPPASSDLSQLKQLAELRDAGIITPEEFEAKKKQILGL